MRHHILFAAGAALLCGVVPQATAWPVGPVASAPKAKAAEAPCPCPAPVNKIQVPLEGKRYAGPTRHEGEVMKAYGKKYSVSLTIDGAPKTLTLSTLNPGTEEMLMWSTVPLKDLGDAEHVAVITVVDLAVPACPRVDVVRYRTKM